jgi:hypothetical protein
LSYTSSSAAVEYVPPIGVHASSACLASVLSCAERASIASGEGCAAGGGLGHRSPGAESVGDVSGGSVGVGGVGDVAEERVGVDVGLVSVGDGSEVGHGSVGEGSAVGVGSVGEGSAVGVGSIGEGSAVGVGSIGEGVGVGLGSVGEGSVEGGGLSVGAQVSVRSEGVCVDVGSICATARPPRADPKTAVAASTARTQARRLTAVARRLTAVARRRAAVT